MKLYRQCPRCASENFYIDIGESLVFLKVTQEGEIDFFKDSETVSDVNIISCTQCSWEGEIDELKIIVQKD